MCMEECGYFEVDLQKLMKQKVKEYEKEEKSKEGKTRKKEDSDNVL